MVHETTDEKGESLSYHVDARLQRFLDKSVKESLASKDKDYVMLVDGYEGCLAGDTLIQLSRFKLSRKYKLEKLYLNFNGLGDKRWDRKQPSYIRAFNGKDIRLHKIKKVIYSGKKLTYILKLQNKTIKATATHKFLTRNGWKELKDIKKGEEIMCDNLNAKKSNRKRIKLYDIQLPVIYHPHPINRHRVEVHRLIYEARMNNLGFTEFLDILLNEPKKAKNLKYVNTNIFCIHHKDGFHYNNSIDNLELIKKDDHLKYHGINGGYSNFSQGIPVFEKVISIIKNKEEDVYDISCEEPYHNFVANGIIVHNSGKSTFAQQIGKYVDSSLNLARICMTADEFKAAVLSADKDQCVIYDEAVTGMVASDSISRVGKLLKSLMMQMRQKNLFIIIILPAVFEFNRYAVLSRARSLFHIYEHKGKRGYFVGYNRKDLRRLYIKGKQTYSYRVRSRFIGRFYGKYVVNEEEYRKKKASALELIDKSEEESLHKWKEQRNNCIKELHKLKYTYKQISDMLAARGTPIAVSVIGHIFEKEGPAPKKS